MKQGELARRVIKKDIYNLECEVERLESLIHHCWIHSGYKDCGRRQMDADERGLYDSVISRVSDELNK